MFAIVLLIGFVSYVYSEHTEKELYRMRVSDLRSLIAEKGLECSDCVEKKHLVDFLLFSDDKVEEAIVIEETVAEKVLPESEIPSEEEQVEDALSSPEENDDTSSGMDAETFKMEFMKHVRKTCPSGREDAFAEMMNQIDELGSLLAPILGKDMNTVRDSIINGEAKPIAESMMKEWCVTLAKEDMTVSQIKEKMIMDISMKFMQMMGPNMPKGGEMGGDFMNMFSGMFSGMKMGSKDEL